MAEPPPPLRIMMPIHSFEPGGVERVGLRLAAEWQSLGHEVRIVLGREQGALREWAPLGLRYLLPKQPPIGTAPWETIWMMIVLRRYILRERPDLLFCPGNSYTVVMGAMKLLLGKRCPPIVAKISNDLGRPDMPAVGRWFYGLWLRLQGRFLDRIVGLTEANRAEIIREMRAPPEKVVAISNPALSEAQIASLAAARHEPREPVHGRTFTAVGRLVPQKNYPLMLQAFSRAAAPNDRLILLGEGSERARIERTAAALGISHRVELPGHVTDLEPWLARADVYLLSSDYEGVPSALLEALAAGLPVIATRASVSMEELLDGGRLGRLVPVGDVDAFARAIGEAEMLPRDVRAMREKAEKFTLERSAAAFLQLMVSLIRPQTQAKGGSIPHI